MNLVFSLLFIFKILNIQCILYDSDLQTTLNQENNSENTGTDSSTVDDVEQIYTLDDSDVVDNSDNVEENIAEVSSEGGAVNTTKNRLVCNMTDDVSDETVMLVNGSEYQSLIFEEFNSSVSNRSQSAVCSITMFFASWCQFSAEAAPHYNALARVFPRLRLYAVDSSEYHSLNTQFGVMAVPSIFVFHNSRPLYKYNYTEYSLENLSQFVTLLTGIDAVNGTEVLEQDYVGPVPSVPVVGRNYYLLLATIFTLVCITWELSTSRVMARVVDSLRNNWREAEIQHQHQD